MPKSAEAHAPIKCSFCPRTKEPGDHFHYIYPVPDAPPFEGAYACSECFPEVERKQVAAGLLDLNGVRRAA